MSRLLQTLEPLRSKGYQFLDKIRVMFFGINNERLEFLIDSFQKLRPNQQKLVFAMGSFAIITAIVFAGFLYIRGVHRLKQDLYHNIAAQRKLSDLSSQYQASDSQFQNLVLEVQKKTESVSSFKSIFETISKDVDVNLASLNEKMVPLSDGDLLSEKMNEIQVDVAMDNTSLPKIFKYIIALERSGNHLSVTDLSIRARYETKLYFDTKVAVRGYLIK